jgi:CMP-N-acetylneuraminic acid synthetase
MVIRAANLASLAVKDGLADYACVSYDDYYTALNDVPKPVNVIPRSEPMRQQHVTTFELVKDFLSSRPHYDIIGVMLPSQPLRTLKHLIQSRLMLTPDRTHVMSYVLSQVNPSYFLNETVGDKLLRVGAAKDSNPWPVVHDGTIIWAWASWVKGESVNDWYCSTSIGGYRVDPMESVDVNTARDYRIAQALL